MNKKKSTWTNRKINIHCMERKNEKGRGKKKKKKKKKGGQSNWLKFKNWLFFLLFGLHGYILLRDLTANCINISIVV